MAILSLPEIKVQKSIIDHSLDGKDTEVLIQAKVSDGKHMNNPVAIEINPIERSLLK